MWSFELHPTYKLPCIPQWQIILLWKRSPVGTLITVSKIILFIIKRRRILEWLWALALESSILSSSSWNSLFIDNCTIFPSLFWIRTFYVILFKIVLVPPIPLSCFVCFPLLLSPSYILHLLLVPFASALPPTPNYPISSTTLFNVLRLALGTMPQ